MINIITDYLTDKIANDLISFSTVLAIKEVVESKCRYKAPRNVSFSVSWECASGLYPKIRDCSNKCYKCGKGKLLVEVRLI